MSVQRVLLVLALGVGLAGCGSGSTTAVTATTGTDSEPSAAVVKTWPTRWCQAHPGMTRTQLYAIMGRPTQEILTGTDPQASWAAFQFMFNAFFDVDGKVRQLDVNEAQLTAAERAQIHCDSTRRAA